MKKIFIIILLYLIVSAKVNAQSPSQQVTAIQYFFDSDPGVGVPGNGAILPVTPAASVNQNLSITIPGSLTLGMHALYIRTQDEDGRWSIAGRRLFFIHKISQQVTALQYFFDNDFNNTVTIPVTPAATVNQNIAITIPNSLAVGMHTLNLRVTDGTGPSVAGQRIFYVHKNTQQVTEVQFYLDNDPGAGITGNGAILPVTPSSEIDQILSFTPASGVRGYHYLFSRAKDEFGKWSLFEGPLAVAIGLCINGDIPAMTSWWSLDSLSNGVVKDIADVHDGIPLNGTLIRGAATFDGIDDYIAVPDDSTWNFSSNNFTIECFASFANPGGTDGHPNDNLIGQGGAFNQPRWTFALSSNLFLNVNGTIYASAPFTPVRNKWYHLAVTRKADTLRTYVDGVQLGYQVVPGLVMPDVNTPLTMGWVDMLYTHELGFMTGSLDEMTIYHRALSAQEINDIATVGSGKCKNISITTTAISDAKYGTPFSQTLEAENGVPPYTWSVAAGTLPAGITLSSTGVLSGTPSVAGEYPWNVIVTDANNATAQKSFTMKVMLTLPEPQIEIFKSGTVPVPGRSMDYFIQVKNTGTVTVQNQGIVELLEPKFRYLSSSPVATTLVESPNYFTNPEDTTNKEPSIINWEIPFLSPGAMTILSYKVKLHPTVPLNKLVAGCACITASECVDTYWRILYEYRLLICSPNYESCRAQNNPNIPCATDLHLCMDDAESFAKTRYINCLKDVCSCDTSTTQGAVDPNEKLVLAAHYIKPDQLLPYVIHFENIGTIEAQDVFLRDTLDNNLDETTLEIITPGGTFNPVTRVLSWDFYGINLLPDSSAYVLYSAKPKPNLPSGTVIKNKASIQFEVFTPMSTNETENIIDLSVPEGVMNALPDTTYQTTFPVSWSGTDAVGEIKGYSVFVSTDGGGYTPFLKDTKDTTAFFTGETGKTYRFICIAEDLAGNIELQQPVAEATTQLRVLCTNAYYYDADGDGFGNVSIRTYACSQPSGWVTDSTDCNDAKTTVHPGAVEICGNRIDDNCNGQVDEGCCNLTVNAGPDEHLLFGYAAGQCKTKTVVVTNGTAPFTYSWVLDRPLLAGETMTGTNTASVTVCLMDTAQLCLVVTDANNCTATDCAMIFAEDVRCFAGNNQKVKICHNGNTICVDQNAVTAHLAHGDYLGQCIRTVMNPSENNFQEISINGFTTHPNPATNQFTIQNNNNRSLGMIRIYNGSGKMVYQKFIGNSQTIIDVQKFVSGVYYLKSDQFASAIKFIKQ